MYIFFDLDGTLIDTLPDIHNSVNKALIANKLDPITFMQTKSFIGHGSKNLMLKASNDNFTDKLLADYLSIYHANLHNDSKVYIGVKETLEKLKKAGHVLGVYSNKDNSDVNKIINYYFPNYFDYILGKQPNYPLKPNPELMERIINQEKMDKENFIYVGDMQTDYDLAHNLEVKFIFCTYGYSKEEINSIYKIAKFADLLQVIWLLFDKII